AAGNPVNPSSNQTVTLSKGAGSAGTLSGTLTGTITTTQSPVGTVTISPVTYSQPATGVVIHAATNGGFTGDSAPFTVSAPIPTSTSVTCAASTVVVAHTT